MNFTCKNLGINDQGHLTFAGQDTVTLAEKYGTPLWLIDEDRIRENCRVYTETFRECFPENSRPLYAGKALAFRRLYRVLSEEGMGIDVVSPGEIFTALSAGFDLSLACFHGNNKTDEDIRYALQCGVGLFAVDNAEELRSIEREAAALGMTEKVILRLTPGIDPHTYAAVNTGMVDSKFGAAIDTGQAEELLAEALLCKHLSVEGYHCHVGSQVFGEDVFERAAEKMLRFAKEMQDRYGFACRVLDLGGGYGVRYVESDPVTDIRARLKCLAAEITELCGGLGIAAPAIHLEPGRSIAADAGMTLYTAGNVKRIPGYKAYVSVDGGMSDNPRFALYGSKYTCLAAGKMTEDLSFTCDLVGRLCESGDILQQKVCFPESLQRGDLIAVCTTGAYNYSMSSRYNRLLRPPVVMLKGGESSVAVRRESFEDLIAGELL